MNTFLNILKDRQVGKWCKVAAWVVTAIGLVNIALQIYTMQSQYSAFSQLGGLESSIVYQEIRLVLSTIPGVILFFFILYAAGVVVDYVAARKANEETNELETAELDEEDESDLALDEEDGEAVTPGQME